MFNHRQSIRDCLWFNMVGMGYCVSTFFYIYCIQHTIFFYMHTITIFFYLLHICLCPNNIVAYLYWSGVLLVPRPYYVLYLLHALQYWKVKYNVNMTRCWVFKPTHRAT